MLSSLSLLFKGGRHAWTSKVHLLKTWSGYCAFWPNKRGLIEQKRNHGTGHECKCLWKLQNSLLLKNNLPEKFPLDISLFKDSMICVDHSSSQNREQDNKDGELVESPEHVTRNVRNGFFDGIFRLAHSTHFDFVRTNQVRIDFQSWWQTSLVERLCSIEFSNI